MKLMENSMTALYKMKKNFEEDQDKLFNIIIASAFGDIFEKSVIEECNQSLMSLTRPVIYSTIDELFSEEEAAVIIKFREDLQPKTEHLSKVLEDKLEKVEPALHKILEDTYNKHYGK